MTKIRRATIKDLKQIYELHQKMDEEEISLGCNFSNKIDKDYLKNMILNEKCKFFVCVDANKIIAFGYGEETERGKLLLHNFFTSREYRNQGIANRIYVKILGSFPRITKIEAYVLAKNKPALEFWKRKGFRVIGKLVNAFKIGKSISSDN